MGCLFLLHRISTKITITLKIINFYYLWVLVSSIFYFSKHVANETSESAEEQQNFTDDMQIEMFKKNPNKPKPPQIRRLEQDFVVPTHGSFG